MKKIKYLLQHIDGIWSVPVGFFVFFFIGLLLSSVFGMAVGGYDMAFIQPLALAGTIVIGATNMAIGGLYFTFRGIYKYLYGYKEDNEILNYSKLDFQLLTPIQRICITLISLYFFLLSIIIVYLNLV
mgnify:CR=1 FL=1